MKMYIVNLALLATSLIASEHVVNQSSKEFNAKTIKAKVGDTITFKNSDGFANNAYSDDEVNEFDIGMQKPGQDISIKLTGKSTMQESAKNADKLVQTSENVVFKMENTSLLMQDTSGFIDVTVSSSIAIAKETQDMITSIEAIRESALSNKGNIDMVQEVSDKLANVVIDLNEKLASFKT